MAETSEETASSLMKIVEAIAITPKDARVLVGQYETQARKSHPKASERTIQKAVTDKIISRYSKLSATSGAVTSLPGVIPGVGTAAALVGGVTADISVCMKLQIDMTMCLAIAINNGLSNEDAKHMSFVVALAGTLEKLGSEGTKKLASKAAENIVKQYLKGATLTTIKELFKRIGIKFTQTAALKVIPFGVGVIVGGVANYALTRYVGSVARDVFLLDLVESSCAGDHAAA